MKYQPPVSKITKRRQGSRIINKSAPSVPNCKPAPGGQNHKSVTFRVQIGHYDQNQKSATGVQNHKSATTVRNHKWPLGSKLKNRSLGSKITNRPLGSTLKNRLLGHKITILPPGSKIKNSVKGPKSQTGRLCSKSQMDH